MRRNKKLKKIGAIALCVCLIAGVFGGAMALFNRNNDELKLNYDIGGLTDDGAYVESDKTLYTKEAFECTDLTVRVEFDSNVKYQLFFYDDVDEFVSATEVYTKGANITLPEGATRVRVEITPIWGADVDTEDRVIKWYNISEFANQLHIEASAIEDVEENPDDTSAEA